MLTPEELECALVTEVGHQGDAIAVATDCIVHALLHSHVRKAVERHGYAAFPAMRNPVGTQLRPNFTHLAMKDGGSLCFRHF